MKFRFALVIVLFASLLLFANTNVAQAQWPAINSKHGIAVTTNWHGQEVPLFEDVVATAGTTDFSFDQVEFIWKDPDGNVVRREPVNTFYDVADLDVADLPGEVLEEVIEWADKNPTVTVRYFQDTLLGFEVVVTEWWGVQAIFHSVTEQKEATDKFKATSFFVVDEVPFGTIVVLLIPFGFLSVYAIKRKHRISIKTP